MEEWLNKGFAEEEELSSFEWLMVLCRGNIGLKPLYMRMIIQETQMKHIPRLIPLLLTPQELLSLVVESQHLIYDVMKRKVVISQNSNSI